MRRSILLTCTLVLMCGCVKNKIYEAHLPETPATEHSFTLNSNKVFVHPGAVVSRADLDRAKSNLTNSPWSAGYSYLTGCTAFKDKKAPAPLPYIIRGGQGTWEPAINDYIPADNFGRARYEVLRAYANAVYWQLTGNVAAGDLAVKILNSWPANCQGVYGDTNRALAFGEFGYGFANAGELLRDYPGWQKADQDTFKAWMLKVFVPGNLSFMKREGDYGYFSESHYWSNWDLFNTGSLLSIGVFCDRPDLYNYGLDYIQNGGGNGNWKNYIRFIHPAIPGQDDIDLGQTQESGRDQGHNVLSIELGALICRTAWNQGDDVFAYRNNAFLKAAEYVAKYNYALGNINRTDWTYPFTPYWPNTDEYHSKISSDSRGRITPIWRLIYNHYKIVNKLEPRNVKYAAGRYSESDTDDNAEAMHSGLAFGTLLFSEQ